MKVFTEDRSTSGMRGGLHMMHGHRGPGGHLPPHERRAMMHVEFDDGDWALLEKVFGDEDTAEAAAAIIREAPPEIQILVIQLTNMIEEVA